MDTVSVLKTVGKLVVAIGTVAIPIVAAKRSSDENKGKISEKKLNKLKSKGFHLTEYDWYCDECNAYLNDQKGFSTKKGHWKCRECGYDNSISILNTILEEDILPALFDDYDDD